MSLRACRHLGKKEYANEVAAAAGVHENSGVVPV
jgi:hypothetical protein